MINIEDCWYSAVCPEVCSNSCIRFLEMKYLVESSGLPESKWFPVKLDANSVDYNAYIRLAEIKQNILSHVESGDNIYIYSTITGNGKTTWSIKLLLKYFDEVWAGNGFRCRGLFISVPALLVKLKNFGVKDLEFESLKQLIPDVDLVVWDDIASTSMSSYDHSQLLSLVDQRILANKSNIFTGNLCGADMEKQLGVRLTSRVWNNSTCIEFNGGDKR